jgi:hypothetical protein
LEDIKQKIVEENEEVEESSRMVAFDIKFLYRLSNGTSVELQPKD